MQTITIVFFFSMCHIEGCFLFSLSHSQVCFNLVFSYKSLLYSSKAKAKKKKKSAKIQNKRLSGKVRRVRKAVAVLMLTWFCCHGPLIRELRDGIERRLTGSLQKAFRTTGSLTSTSLEQTESFKDKN